MMKKWVILGIVLCGALLALPALSEQADAPADQPAQQAQPAKAVKAVPIKAKVPVPVKARIKAPALPVKAVATKAGLTKAGPTKAVDEPEETTETEEAVEEATSETVTSLPESVAGFVVEMSEQIKAVGGRPVCDEEGGRCRYRYRGAGEQSHEIHLWYGETSKTIYIFVNHYASAEGTNAATPVLMRHLSAMSRSLGIARFEWNEADGEVRLSTVMNVDTNFDRNALRGLLRFIQDSADRFKPQIDSVLENHEEAPIPPQPSAGETPDSVSDRYGYMSAIEEELTTMGLNATCDADAGRCTFELDSEEARNVFNISVQYNSQSNTVLVVAERFLSATTDNPRTDRLLQRITALNWQQLVPMFQWDASDGQMRVVGVINTDSNLDRRAFRSVVQSVNQVAARHYRELRGMLNP